MKCKFIADNIEYAGPKNAHMDDTHEVEIKRNYRQVKVRMWNKGVVLEHPESFRLVQMGIAIHADDECKDRANMNPEMIENAAFAYERLQRGIYIDDFDRYDRGELIGYNADGSDIPGPNAATFDDDGDEEEEDDDDDVDEGE